MRIIFHLGSYKTGSTTFQNLLFENRDLLLANGVLYPLTGLAKDQKLGHRHAPLIYNYTGGKSDVCPDALLKELSESSAEIAIFSSEAWSRPGHLSHLTRLVSILKENGYCDCSGFLVLRNLEDYQVSNYREFTVNQNNALPYDEYIRYHHAMFDYLFLSRSLRSIFESRFYALRFDKNSDIVVNLLAAMGIDGLYNKMRKIEQSNVKSEGAIEVEAMRCANSLKLQKLKGISMLSKLISEDSSMQDKIWTERHSGDAPNFTSNYRRSLRNTLDWSESDIEFLLTQSDPKGLNVKEMTSALIERLRGR